jgi:hypothetical protein
MPLRRKEGVRWRGSQPVRMEVGEEAQPPNKAASWQGVLFSTSVSPKTL